MTRTFTKTEDANAVTYAGNGIELTIDKTGNGDLQYTIVVTDPNDPAYRSWATLCGEIEEENTIL